MVREILKIDGVPIVVNSELFWVLRHPGHPQNASDYTYDHSALCTKSLMLLHTYQRLTKTAERPNLYLGLQTTVIVIIPKSNGGSTI